VTGLLDTDDIRQGVNNLYFTNAAAVSAIVNNGGVTGANPLTFGSLTNTLTLNGGIVGDVQIITGKDSATVSRTTLTTILDAGATSIEATLGIGQQGQIKNLYFLAGDATNNANISCTGIHGGATFVSISFTAVDTAATLLYINSSGWVALSGRIPGGEGPAYIPPAP
jgi:hypothetical protein